MSNIIDLEHKYLAQNYAPLNVTLVRGEGALVWDADGKKYIDMMSAYSAVSHGHCHLEIIAALVEQAQKLCVTSRAFYNDKLGLLAEKICKISGFDKVLFMNSGAEAVETAIKAARLWGYKVKKIKDNQAKIITFNNNFHGRTTTIISFSSEAAYRNGFGPFTPGFINVDFGDIKAFKAAITDEVCAVIVEPIQGEGGIIIPPHGFLKQVQEVCKKHNILLILDEIQTGLARSGKLFAYEYEIERPDAIILGKALGGGVLPVSAFLSKSEVMDLFTPGSHGSTFGGNPLAANVAYTALEILLAENFVAKSYELGAYLMQQLKSIDSKLIKEVRGRGLLIGIELDPKYITGKKMCKILADNGLLSKDTHETVIRLAPPLMISKELLDVAIQIIKTSVKHA